MRQTSDGSVFWIFIQNRLAHVDVDIAHVLGKAKRKEIVGVDVE